MWMNNIMEWTEMKYSEAIRTAENRSVWRSALKRTEHEEEVITRLVAIHVIIIIGMLMIILPLFIILMMIITISIATMTNMTESTMVVAMMMRMLLLLVIIMMIITSADMYPRTASRTIALMCTMMICRNN